MLDMRDSGQKRCRMEEMHDRRDAEIKVVSTPNLRVIMYSNKSASEIIGNLPITERYIHSTVNRLGLNSI